MGSDMTRQNPIGATAAEHARAVRLPVGFLDGPICALAIRAAKGDLRIEGGEHAVRALPVALANHNAPARDVVGDEQAANVFREGVAVVKFRRWLRAWLTCHASTPRAAASCRRGIPPSRASPRASSAWASVSSSPHLRREPADEQRARQREHPRAHEARAEPRAKTQPAH